MPQLNYNTADALQQERIRRGPHTFGPGPDGKNIYQPATPLHQEYPKVMDKTPAPKMADFKGKPDAAVLLEQAVKDWEAGQTASIVRSKSEEERWLRENATPEAAEETLEPVVAGTAGKKGRKVA